MSERTFRVMVRGAFDGLTDAHRAGVSAEDMSLMPPAKRQRKAQAAG